MDPSSYLISVLVGMWQLKSLRPERDCPFGPARPSCFYLPSHRCDSHWEIPLAPSARAPRPFIHMPGATTHTHRCTGTGAETHTHTLTQAKNLLRIRSRLGQSQPAPVARRTSLPLWTTVSSAACFPPRSATSLQTFPSSYFRQLIYIRYHSKDWDNFLFSLIIIVILYLSASIAFLSWHLRILRSSKYSHFVNSREN